MTVAPEADNVRKLVVKTFGELGAAESSLFDMEETIVIDDGKYAARSYRIRGYMAMWLVPAGLVQFYDAEGNMLATLNLFEERHALKRAA